LEQEAGATGAIFRVAVVASEVVAVASEDLEVEALEVVEPVEAGRPFPSILLAF
jgi:hypothetical protein